MHFIYYMNRLTATKVDSEPIIHITLVAISLFM